jgi:nucleoside-diphosphate-sugar epimerase
VVEANLAACASSKAPGEMVNIACGDRVTISGLAIMIGEIIGNVIEPKLKPARSGDVRHSLADITRAQDVLGYRVRVNLREGLERTIEWYAGKRPKKKVRSS